MACCFRMNESDWERSRSRWREAPSEWRGLTWGQELAGDAFVETAERYAGFAQDKHILEIGPGYGRLLKACLDRGVPFASYCGLDLSEETCAYLRERFSIANVAFAHGDVEQASFHTEFDVVFSSATFQHLYPSMEAALSNLRSNARPGCTFCIDLPEGTFAGFEQDNVTFIHQYTRSDLLEMYERVGLEHVAFDEVVHAPGLERLFAVARKPA
jgi:SAM-dependent methyltransferase